METADLAASNAVIILVMESWAEVGCVELEKSIIFSQFLLISSTVKDGLIGRRTPLVLSQRREDTHPAPTSYNPPLVVDDSWHKYNTNGAILYSVFNESTRFCGINSGCHSGTCNGCAMVFVNTFLHLRAPSIANELANPRIASLAAL